MSMSPTIRGRAPAICTISLSCRQRSWMGASSACLPVLRISVDMGGVGRKDAQIWHEGLFIPLLRLARAGEMNEDLLAMIRANVREPVQVIGDVYALIACNEIGGRRLVAMMREF